MTRTAIIEILRCPCCGGAFHLQPWKLEGDNVEEGLLRSSCGRCFPIIKSVPRILPPGLMGTLSRDHGDFFRRHPEIETQSSKDGASLSSRTLQAFGNEWKRFPSLERVHETIFNWYFEGLEPVRWKELEVLDAGCGMGRWLHFARQEGARVIGLDVSPAIDVAYARDGPNADFVQADLLWPPFAQSSFDLVYSLGVVHHLTNPLEGVRGMASLVRPGGELRLYVYRSLEDESWAKRRLLSIVTAARKVTTRLPFAGVHAIAWTISLWATALFLVPRRLLRHTAWGERMTADLPLVHYADVPFRMLVAEQFDRFVAPVEKRHRREEVESWIRAIGFSLIAILPGLGWRVIARRPDNGQMAQGDRDGPSDDISSNRSTA